MRFIPSIRALLFALVIMVMSAASFAQIGISVSFGPPALPVYEQPPCPAEGYLWTPGYWAYSDDGYYWVPGTWVMAPEPGLLWTPPYWGWGGNRFVFYDGYWGQHVGFYGGISYGYGYFGEGYEGGRWDHDRFFYNRSVNNVNVTNIHNVYNTTVINNTTINRVSYNGGEGGREARPTPQQENAARERHVSPVVVQAQHIQAARANPELRASANQGRPPIAATPKPGAFNDREVVRAKEAGAPYKAEANRGGEQPKAVTSNRPESNVPRPPTGQGEAARSETPAARPENNVPRPPPSHAKELQPHPRPPAPDTGNAKVDQKYQQQQNKLYARQDQDHQKLQQKQEQDHQRLAQRNADVAKNQQIEQRHQQQTQQLEQKHEQQAQHLQARQPQNLQARQQPQNHGENNPKQRP